MSDETQNGAGVEIVHDILAQAESQAEQVREEARRRAAEEMEKGVKEAEGIVADILARAGEKARRHRARELATAHVEAQRMLLRAREEALTQVIGKIGAALDALRGDRDRYRASLVRLAAEAAHAVGDAVTELRFAARDKPLVDDGLLADIRAAIRERGGETREVAAAFEPGDFGGGCIAVSRDGRIRFDNSYRARVARKLRELRIAIAGEIKVNHE